MGEGFDGLTRVEFKRRAFSRQRFDALFMCGNLGLLYCGFAVVIDISVSDAVQQYGQRCVHENIVIYVRGEAALLFCRPLAMKWR